MKDLDKKLFTFPLKLDFLNKKIIYNVQDSILLIITGKSGSGKTTIRKVFEGEYFSPIIMSTTRKKRKGEIEGYDYFFMEKERFDEKDLILVGENHNGDKYGVNIEQLLEKENKVLVTGIDGIEELSNIVKKGILNYKKLFLVYLNFENNILKERLKKRGDNIQEIENRLVDDDKKFANFQPKLDYITINKGNIIQVKIQILENLIQKYPHIFINYLLKY